MLEKLLREYVLYRCYTVHDTSGNIAESLKEVLRDVQEYITALKIHGKPEDFMSQHNLDTIERWEN